MKFLLFGFLISISFSQKLNLQQSTLSQLEIAVENASRSGRIVWAEEFSGLS
jgi:hypothetical protein